MPVSLQSCLKYFVNVVMLQSRTRFPPMLAGLPVSIDAEIYVRHLRSFFHDNRVLFFCTRYVDNRLVVVSRQLLQDRRLLHFLTNNFYQAPVEP